MAKAPNVLFIGSPYWCRYLARLMREYGILQAYTGRQVLMWLLRPNKVVCLAGLGPPDTYKRRFYHWLAYLGDLSGIVRKRVIYWIGSDVCRLPPGSTLVRKADNIAGSAWLADEVRAQGYDCVDKLFPVKLPVSEPLPFPDAKRLQVLCYVPDAHHELHGSAEIRAIAQRHPDADFCVAGGVGSWWPEHPPNVRFLGWTNDMAAQIAASHVLLRRTSHDSLSAFVREGLVSGRQVVFTRELPGVIHVEHGDIPLLMQTMQDLREALAADRLSHNDLPSEFRATLVDIRSQLQSLADAYG